MLNVEINKKEKLHTVMSVTQLTNNIVLDLKYIHKKPIKSAKYFQNTYTGYWTTNLHS